MNEMADYIGTYIENSIKPLVDYPKEVEVTVSVSTKTIIVQIKVEKTDCGKVIGKHGRSIEALKILCLNVKNTQFPNDSRRIMIEVLEDENSEFTYK